MRVGVSAVGTVGTSRRTSTNVRVAVGVRAVATVPPSAISVCVGVSAVASPTVRVDCAVGMTVGTVTVSPSSSQGVVGDGTSVGTGISVGDSTRPEEKSMSLLSSTEEIGRADSPPGTAGVTAGAAAGAAAVTAVAGGFKTPAGEVGDG